MVWKSFCGSIRIVYVGGLFRWTFFGDFFRPFIVTDTTKSNPYQITSIQIINILLGYYSLNRIVHLLN